MNSDGYKEGRHYALRHHEIRGLSYIETLRALPLSLSGGDRLFIQGVISGILSLDTVELDKYGHEEDVFVESRTYGRRARA